jgi:hypothetical protein
MDGISLNLKFKPCTQDQLAHHILNLKRKNATPKRGSMFLQTVGKYLPVHGE